jgi:competence ComEA-like helix-hairpin-helix protein
MEGQIHVPLGGNSHGRSSAAPSGLASSDFSKPRASHRLSRIACRSLVGFLSLSLILLIGILLAIPEKSNANEPARPKVPPLVDINHARVEELASLPGIGKAIARRIVEFREKNGPFRQPEELLIIRGISEKRLKQILPLITLSPDLGKPGRSQ